MILENRDAALRLVRWVLNESAVATRSAAMAVTRTPVPGRDSVDCGRNWISELHHAFKRIYEPHADPPKRIRVYSRTDASEILANGSRVFEVLHDVLVSETTDVPSAGGRHRVVLLTRPIWQVESEVHVSSREVGWDLSKLAVGGAAFKLLITADRADRPAFDGFIEHVTRASSATWFVAYMPSYASSSAGFCRWFEVASPRPTFQLTRFHGGRREDLGEDTGVNHDSSVAPPAV